VVGDGLRCILCTHAHADHSPGSARLKALTGAPILGRPWGPRKRTGGPDVGETQMDPAFIPDRTLDDGEVVRVGDITLRALHTPGHASNHLCFLLEEDGLLFSGDHINNGSTVVIDPPDGDMSQYLAALERLERLPISFILPAHGHVIGSAGDAIRKLIAHRLGRERKVIAALRRCGPSTRADLLKVVYDDTRPQLHPIAERSLLAHLEKLAHENRVRMQSGYWTLIGAHVVD
jgi:glyoxylase-like metal-dependent hydrolase (beta-lactamase superfamily II)